jgi:N-carbamoyl-L-amino-acid hydrolase
MPINPKRTVQQLKELRELTSDADGAQRVAWTDTWLTARKWFWSKLSGLPVQQHLDAAGFPRGVLDQANFTAIRLR